MNNNFISFNTILDQARRLIAGQFTKRKRVLPDEINCILRKKRIEGMANSGPEIRAVRDACEQEIQKKTDIVWDSLQKAHKAYGSPKTKTLTTDLKQEIRHHIEKIIQDASELMAKRLRLTEPTLLNANLAYFEKTKSEVKQEYDGEVDIYVASLKYDEPQEKAGQEKTDVMDYRSLTKIPISKLIKYGEGHVLEFKETLEYDIKQNKINKNLNKECLKTIVAFLNTDGGILLIGVKDNGEVAGIDQDLQHVQRKNLDGFELKLRDLIRNRFDPAPFNKVRINFEKHDIGTICKINVDPVNLSQVIHLDGKEVYIRDGNMTIKLDGMALTNWIQQRAQASNTSKNN